MTESTVVAKLVLTGKVLPFDEIQIAQPFSYDGVIWVRLDEHTVSDMRPMLSPVDQKRFPHRASRGAMKMPRFATVGEVRLTLD